MYKYIAAITLLAQPVLAQDMAVVAEYEIRDLMTKRYDENCIMSVEDHVGPQFEGASQVRLPVPQVIDLAADDSREIIYPGAVFSGLNGDVEATVLCIIERGTAEVLEVAAIFEGEGLAGYRAHPLAGLGAELADLRATQHVVAIER